MVPCLLCGWCQMSLVSKEWMDAHKTDGPPPKHPIGIPDADPKVAVKTASSLDHSAEVCPGNHPAIDDDAEQADLRSTSLLGLPHRAYAR